MKRVPVVLFILGLSLAGSLILWAVSTNPVPFINEPLVPGTVVPGGAAFALNVNGTGFVSGSVVKWNGTAQTTTFVSSSQLTASIAASDIAAAGTASVTVVNPTPGGGDSNVVYILVTTAAGAVATNPSSIVSNGNVGTVVAADFNLDGKLDLITTEASGVQIFLGNGDGTFQAPLLIPLPGGTGTLYLSGALFSADFNGDGKPDIVAINASGTAVTVLLGNGDGTFQAPLNSPIDTSITNPSWLATGDFDGDGKLDLVVSYQGFKGVVSVLLGNGDGTFQPYVNYATACENTEVGIGDFNGDGRLDLAAVNFANGANCGGVSVLLGNGDGTFQPYVSYPGLSGSPIDLVVADFNGDGKLDLALAGECDLSSPTCGAQTVAILLGKGDGSFAAPVLYDTDGSNVQMVAGDFSGDGKLDLALTDYTVNGNIYSGNVTFLFGNGDGTFRPHFGISTIGHPAYLIAGDFTNDGLLDLVLDGTSYNNTGGAGHPLELLKQNQAPVAVLSSANLNLGNQDVGVTSAAQTVTLSNLGRTTLTFTTAMSGANRSDFSESDNCAGLLAAGANCTISVTFKPSAMAAEAATLIITDDSVGVAGSTQSVSLTGQGSDFSVAVASGTPSSATVKAGSPASYTISVGPLGGFNQTVTMSCTGAPSLSTCTATPSPTLDGTNVASVIVSVSTNTAMVVMPRAPQLPASPYSLALLSLLALAAFLIASKRSRATQQPALVAVGLVLMAMTFLGACGGGGGNHNPGTPPGTYTLTITGTSGSLSHSTTVTLTVN